MPRVADHRRVRTGGCGGTIDPDAPRPTVDRPAPVRATKGVTLLTAPRLELLPTRIADYAPGRITEVPASAWPALLAEPDGDGGVDTTLPRYGLDVLARDLPLDPHHVHALIVAADPPLATRRVRLTTYAGRLWVLADRSILAAHLAAGTDPLPVRLVRPAPAA